MPHHSIRPAEPPPCLETPLLANQISALLSFFSFCALYLSTCRGAPLPIHAERCLFLAHVFHPIQEVFRLANKPHRQTPSCDNGKAMYKWFIFCTTTRNVASNHQIHPFVHHGHRTPYAPTLIYPPPPTTPSWNTRRLHSSMLLMGNAAPETRLLSFDTEYFLRTCPLQIPHNYPPNVAPASESL